MGRYVTRRLLQAVLVLWAAYTLSFAVLYLLPGDPVEIMAAGGGEVTEISDEQLDAVRAEYGLDAPLAEQYLDRLGAALTGDLGTSVQTGERVSAMVAEQLPATLQLTCAGGALALLLGSAVALAGAHTRRPWLRQLLLSLPSVGASAPTFWVGLLLIQLVSFRWGLLPAIGDQGWRSLVLPALTLALPTSAVLAQVFAKSLRDALREPYVETALAKGASRARVTLRHAARNASLPAFTVFGVLVGNLLAGSVVVETVFSRTGVGRITATSVTVQDIPVVQGLVVLGAVAFVLANLLVDLVYPLLDPRVTTGGAVAR
ncbi:ABC transporter permease subunit [Streptomyces sp. 3MP-14]|uniref:ABC transporter permease subunit n=1 Tax=Streptomyces mimosae TaxID=2586635 RepID=A0A5N6A144_9ACTN|nr:MULTISPECIES: ABC transporter permease [Streptomyces]KAB8162474.1 ABC transporter permease subunit [Streptomyces mimosae]KAB8174300.1 ABC transporter permease subunit [Streptomyces sp. 3MP-14]